MTESPDFASRTVTWHVSFNLSAKDLVNCSGICWTIIIPGLSGGRSFNNFAIASVPPVEAPTATTISVVSAILLVDTLGITASAVYLGCTSIWGGNCLFRLNLATAAALTASHILILAS